MRPAEGPRLGVRGTACSFHGPNDRPGALAQSFRIGANLVVETPLMRWDVDEYYDPDPT